MTAQLRSQQGAALITGLIFLVVLTLISLSAMKATSLEERMAGNAREQDISFQAAEAGLRDAMKYIATSGLLPTSGFVSGCSAGLCLNNAATPVWKTISANNEWTSSKTKTYTAAPLTSDGTTALPVQPRYIIELLPATIPPSGFSMASGKGSNPGGQVTPYRITARGWGATGKTHATVQAAINY